VKSHHDSWSFLRPLLLALAAAAAWIALSAGGASADTGAADDSDARNSLLGSVGSSLRSVTTNVAHQAKDALEPVEATVKGGPGNAPVSSLPALIPTPTFSPVVEDVTGLADHVVQAVPVVNRAVPPGTVGTAVDPVANTVDTVVDRTVGTVVPVAGTVLEPLDPVVAPVIDVVPLPVITPAEPGVVPPAVTDILGVLTPEPASTTIPSVTDVPQASQAADAAAVADTRAAGTAQGPAAMRHTDSLPGTGPACDTRIRSVANGPVLSEAGPDHAPIPAPSDAVPGMPGSTTGGSSSSLGNGPAVPGWLSAYHFHIPAAGTATIEGRLLAAPAPVSFDPGSSPD